MFTRRRFLGVVSGSGVLVAFGGCAPAVAAEPRRVVSVVAFKRSMVGEVFRIRRTIPGVGLDQVDPFVLLDHFDFTLAPGQLGGLAPHPHKGIETVTVLLEGAIEHGDSLGNRAVLEGGDLQWMTAASGIVHEENPADALRASGGRVLGVQLWVNLPAAAKAHAPGYQDTRAAGIPAVDEAGVRARIIAGAIDGVRSPILTQTPLALFDVTAKPGAHVSLAHPPGWTAFVHVISGDVAIAGTAVGEASLAELDRVGNAVEFVAGASGARVLVGGGEPIAEAMARGGPFVMNTDAELEQAYADYRSGKMGRVANPTYDRVRLPRP